MKKYLCCLLIVFASLFLVACGGKYDYLPNLTSYDLNIVFDENAHEAECKQKTKYVNSSNNTLNFVKFHLYPNAFRENAKAKVVSLSNEAKAYPNGKKYGKIDIKTVKIKNNDAKFEICGEDENILCVSLNNELYPDDNVEIYFEYTVKLANINHRLGYGNNAINLCNFYPIACVYENGDFVCDLYNSNGDPFYSDVSDYNVTITYNNSYKIASTGTLVKKEDNDNFSTNEYFAKSVRDFAFVLSNKFEIKKAEYNNIAVNYYFYDDENADQTVSLICSVMEFFENKIGKYPYSQISVAKTNFVHGGMEYPNCVLISDDAGDYQTYQMVVIHELVHQWWYGVVGNNEFDNGWMDEGLTEFCTVYYFNEHSELGLTMENMVTSSINAYCTFKKVYKDVLGEVDTSMNRGLDEFATEPEYVYNTYTKGMLMFATIYELVGQKKFDKAMKYYYEHNIYKNAKPEYLIKCFCNGSGKNLESLFNAWIQGKVQIMNK